MKKLRQVEINMTIDLFTKYTMAPFLLCYYNIRFKVAYYEINENQKHNQYKEVTPVQFTHRS